MYYLQIILCSYLIGSSSMSFYLSKLKGVDMRSKGSKNLGASNSMILMGWKAGIIVGLHDIGKAALAVLLAKFLFPELPYIGLVAGVSAVIGHIFPFYLGFKGGKGFASYMGMTFALNWKFGLILLVAILLVTLITDYIVAGTVTAILSVPTYIGISDQSLISALILLIATVVIAYKHRDNFVRMWNGTEMKFRKATKGGYS